MRKNSKTKNAIVSILCFILVAVVAFVITSLVMASVHNQSVVAEWQSWFGAAKEVIESGAESVKSMISIKK